MKANRKYRPKHVKIEAPEKINADLCIKVINALADAAEDGDTVAQENLCRITAVIDKMQEIANCARGNNDEEALSLIRGLADDPEYALCPY
jgi:F420-0:gamma-glutamyl ligase